MKADTPETWDAYEFPEWIPEPLRESIRQFWCEEWGRGPRAWLESAENENNHHPPLGALVECRAIGREELHRGRWVPAWNNLGRCVKPDGTVICAGSHGVKVLPEGAEMDPARPAFLICPERGDGDSWSVTRRPGHLANAVKEWAKARASGPQDGELCRIEAVMMTDAEIAALTLGGVPEGDPEQ